MRLPLILIFATLATLATLPAADYHFDVNRYGWISFSTGEKPEVRLIQSGKQAQEDVEFEAKLTKVSDGVYKAPNGTIFTLKKLDKKHPGHPDDRFECNSGDWQLDLSGRTPEAIQTKKKFARMYSWSDKVTPYYGRLKK